MTIDKDFKGLQDCGSIYSYDGNLKGSEIIIKLDKPFLVRGNVNAKHNLTTEGSLWVDGNAKVGGDFTSGNSIMVEGYIKAGGNVIAEKLITTEKNIEAFGSIIVKGYTINEMWVNGGTSDWSIITQGDIIVGKDIIVEGSIWAGGNLIAMRDTQAKGKIRANELA